MIIEANAVDYMNPIKKISLGNWILIAMVLGLLVGLLLNQYHDNPFINEILMNNVFYFGGELFIRLMKMLVVPLVFCSIIMSLASISDIRQLRTIGGRAILFYMLVSAIALIISFTIPSIIQPGVGMNIANAGPAANMAGNMTITETVLNIIPENPVSAMTNGETLAIILFGILIGYILVKFKDEIHVADRVFKELNDLMMILTETVMKFAPIGIFCMMAKTFGTVGFGSIFPLAKLIGCIILGMGILIIIVYPAMLLIFTRSSPLKFFKKYLPVMIFAFSSTSSNATLPLHLDTLEEMGVSRDISSFTIPLGIPLNQTGTLIIYGTVILFAAQTQGIDLAIPSLLIISFIILLGAISAPSVPMATFFSLNMIFNLLGLPLAVINLLMGVYSILDMFETLCNVTGNGICTTITAFLYRSREGSK